MTTVKGTPRREKQGVSTVPLTPFQLHNIFAHEEGVSGIDTELGVPYPQSLGTAQLLWLTLRHLFVE